MAATGSAVGLGNIWKFPYITGEYGGGAFVLVYLACILLIGVPVMIAEVLLGRAGRTDPIDSMLKLAKASNTSPLWAVIGVFGVCAGLMILMFYSVVAGWSLDYVIQSGMGSFIGASPEAIGDSFSQLTANSDRQLISHTAFIILTGGVVAAGVTTGIGTGVRILMPILLALLLVLVGYSMAVGDFFAGLHFMFDTDFSKLCPKPTDGSESSLFTCDAILVAMGHAFFTLSLGMGAILAYGSYMPQDANIGKTVLTVAALDTVIALLAGLAIFPLVFANGLEPGSGPGLLFVTLPIAFSQMPGGQLVGTIFFLLIAIAALSSSISLIEPGIAWLEKKGIKRLWGTTGLVSISWIGGVMSIHSGEVFSFLDDITAKFMLPLGGLMIAIFVGWFMNQSTIMEELEIKSPKIYQSWLWTLRVVSPLGVIAVFANTLGWF
jgi:NSS family neurotransmitter:Na+ symporter